MGGSQKCQHLTRASREQLSLLMLPFSSMAIHGILELNGIFVLAEDIFVLSKALFRAPKWGIVKSPELE